jgi:hypothetical protein
LENLLCSPKPIYTGGNTDLGESWNFDLIVSKCTGSTCKSDGEINEKIRMNYFVVYLMNAKIDEGDGYKPINEFGVNIYTIISP